MLTGRVQAGTLFTRRGILRTAGLLGLSGVGRAFGEERRVLNVVGLATTYHHNSHADMFLSRMMQGYHLDWTPDYPAMRLGAIYVEQQHPKDIGRGLASQCGVALAGSIEGAMDRARMEGKVDGVFFIAEHGEYPVSNTGQFMYPKREWFGRLLKWMESRGEVVPVFIDKMFSHRWEDADWMMREARRVGVPLMAGSTLPMTWRLPAGDTRRGAHLSEIGALSYGRLDSYGFHALEIVQGLAERRFGGECGVRRVRAISGEAVWEALEDGTVDRALYEEVLHRPEGRQIRKDKPLRSLVKVPVLFLVEYEDGLKGSVLVLRELYPDWTAGWRYADGERGGAVFWTQEARPFGHFAHLTRVIEDFFRTGRSPWPVERTLMTTGLLDGLLTSLRDGGGWVETPHLKFRYESGWNWAPLPEPPVGRPIHGL